MFGRVSSQLGATAQCLTFGPMVPLLFYDYAGTMVQPDTAIAEGAKEGDDGTEGDASASSADDSPIALVPKEASMGSAADPEPSKTRKHRGSFFAAAASTPVDWQSLCFHSNPEYPKNCRYLGRE